MYESMYNYVGTLFLFDVFPLVFRFSRVLSMAFLHSILDAAHLGCVVLEKTNNRMTRGGSSSDACEDVPVHRLA